MNRLFLLLRQEKLAQVDRVLKEKWSSPEWSTQNPDDVPSLVSCLNERQEVISIILEPGIWSPQHMAAAAKILRSRRGKLIMLGKRPYSMDKDVSLLIRTEDPLQIPELLENKPATQEKLFSNADTPSSPPSEIRHKLTIPTNGEALYISVASSHEKISCLAQCLVLQQYLERLGFSPALLLTPEQLETCENAGLSLKVLGHSMRLNKVPVTTDCKAGLYNAYIRCVGVLSVENKKRFIGSDWSILECGASPEDLQATAKALAIMDGRIYASVLFSGPEAAVDPEITSSLPYPWAPTTEIPDPWGHLGEELMAPYDKVLYPWLKMKYKVQDYAWEHQEVAAG